MRSLNPDCIVIPLLKVEMLLTLCKVIASRSRKAEVLWPGDAKSESGPRVTIGSRRGWGSGLGHWGLLRGHRPPVRAVARAGGSAGQDSRAQAPIGIPQLLPSFLQQRPHPMKKSR